MVEAQGHVAKGFEGVREAFVANFERYGDVGAAFALYVGGEVMVDLWGGIADTRAERAWEADTPALVYSTTKGVAAIAAHLLAQRGQLDLDAPVARYWPEFAAEGKGAIPVRDLLSHRAGLPTVDGRVTPDDVLGWDPIVERLAAQRPYWEPGAVHGYHALTYGWLLGEVVRRATGRTLGQVVADELSAPLGLDLWIGLPEAYESRVARLLAFKLGEATLKPGKSAESFPADVQAMLRAMADPSSLATRALQLTDPSLDFNSRAVHAAEMPAANGIATARSLARLYAATVGEVDGVRLLDDATVADATREQSNGPDQVLILKTRFGSGFFLPSPFASLMGPRSFGHAGAGGSLAFADPDGEIGFGYVMNAMRQNLSNDLRTLTLIDAVRAALSAA